MPLISIPFLLLFLPASLVFHFFAARLGGRTRLCVLIAISFSFVALWDIGAAAVLAGSIAVNFGIGRLLLQVREDEQELRARVLLALGVLFNLGVLAAFRYGNLLAMFADRVADTGFHIERLLVPLGALVFSCDQIAYLADLYRGKTGRAGMLRYAAFAAFFPRLIAGPLLRYEQIERQWDSPAPDAKDLAVGLATFVIGLAKVVLLAGAVAPFAAMVFSAAESDAQIDFFAGWAGLFAFTCQIYFDLSGYSDMAIGLGRCFGLKLPENFRSPYRATNIIEFFQNWNITLSDFLRDYIYRPLSRHGMLPGVFGLLVAMIAGGLWYGAGLMFVAWGMLQAAFILVHRVWRLIVARKDVTVALGRLPGTIITFAAVTLGWIVFRSPDPASAINLFAALSGQNGAVLPIGSSTSLEPLLSPLQSIGISLAPSDWHTLLWAWGSILLCLIVIFALPNTQTLLSSYLFTKEDRTTEPFLSLRRLPPSFWPLALGVLAFGCLVSSGDINPLLHWRFWS